MTKETEKVHNFIYLRQHSSLASNSNLKCKYLQNCRDCITLEEEKKACQLIQKGYAFQKHNIDLYNNGSVKNILNIMHAINMVQAR